MKLAWFAPPTIHTQAEQLGLLADSELNFEGIANRSSDEQLEFLESGHVDAVITSMDNVIVWNRRSDLDLRIIAQVEGTTGISLLCRPEIDSIAGLSGKRLLVDSAANGFVIALRALLAQGGVDFDQCEIEQTGGVVARLERMIEGGGDATLLGPPFTEMAEAKGLKRLADVQTEYPAFPGQGIVLPLSALQQKTDEISAYLAILEISRARCIANRDTLAARLVASGMTSEVAQRLASSVGHSLRPAIDGIRLLVEHRHMLGLPGGDVTPESLVDFRMLDRMNL